MNDWKQKLEYSLAAAAEFDCRLLKEHIPGCVSVRKTDVETDKTGIDYVATLHGGAEVYIDAKTREQGCSRFWKNGIPELAVEIWSNRERKTQGWAWSGKSNVDYILYTFARSDCDRYWFIPFQLMRKALYENAQVWFRKYPYKTQRSNTWTSGALFIPAPELVAAVTACMEGAAPYAQREVRLP